MRAVGAEQRVALCGVGQVAVVNRNIPHPRAVALVRGDEVAFAGFVADAGIVVLHPFGDAPLPGHVVHIVPAARRFVRPPVERAVVDDDVVTRFRFAAAVEFEAALSPVVGARLAGAEADVADDDIVRPAQEHIPAGGLDAVARGGLPCDGQVGVGRADGDAAFEGDRPADAEHNGPRTGGQARLAKASRAAVVKVRDFDHAPAASADRSRAVAFRAGERRLRSSLRRQDRQAQEYGEEGEGFGDGARHGVCRGWGVNEGWGTEPSLAGRHGATCVGSRGEIRRCVQGRLCFRFWEGAPGQADWQTRA